MKKDGQSTHLNQKLCNRYNRRHHSRVLQQTNLSLRANQRCIGDYSRLLWKQHKKLLLALENIFQRKTQKKCFHRTSPSVTLSPHSCDLLCIFGPVKRPLLWCLQVSEECSMPSGSSVLLTCLRLLSLFMLCKKTEAKQHIYICQVLLMLLMLQSYSDATLHHDSLSMGQFSKTHPQPYKASAHSGCFGSFLCVCLCVLIPTTKYSNWNKKYWDCDYFLKLHQCGWTGNEKAQWTIVLHCLSQLNQSHWWKTLWRIRGINSVWSITTGQTAKVRRNESLSNAGVSR